MNRPVETFFEDMCNDNIAEGIASWAVDEECVHPLMLAVTGVRRLEWSLVSRMVESFKSSGDWSDDDIMNTECDIENIIGEYDGEIADALIAALEQEDEWDALDAA